MKTSLLLLFFVILTKLSYSQQVKEIIDYQYFRDDESYYAFELFKSPSSKNDALMLNFTLNSACKKIDKIYIQAGAKQVKLRFKIREDVVSSDNPDQRFYPIIFSSKDLEEKEVGCEAIIIFKMDNGLTYTLPFNKCI